jgi:hypothetical protein
VEVAQTVPLPEYRSLLDQARDELVRDGKPYDIEFKIKRLSDGAILDVHSKAVWDNQSKFYSELSVISPKRSELEKSLNP